MYPGEYNNYISSCIDDFNEAKFTKFHPNFRPKAK